MPYIQFPKTKDKHNIPGISCRKCKNLHLDELMNYVFCEEILKTFETYFDCNKFTSIRPKVYFIGREPKPIICYNCKHLHEDSIRYISYCELDKEPNPNNPFVYSDHESCWITIEKI